MGASTARKPATERKAGRTTKDILKKAAGKPSNETEEKYRQPGAPWWKVHLPG